MEIGRESNVGACARNFFPQVQGNVVSDTTYQVVPERKFTARDYWWSIPQPEIDQNKERITQNEGWK